MGHASNRKKSRRVERATDARKLRIVVCSYPDRSLDSAAELLKAAIVWIGAHDDAQLPGISRALDPTAFLRLLARPMRSSQSRLLGQLTTL